MSPRASTDADRELVRQVDGDVDGDIKQGENYAWRLLEATKLRCQMGARVHNAIECITCPRFVNFVPSFDHSAVTIRCEWNNDDCVGDVMKLAVAAPSVTPQTSLIAADTQARREGLRHLLVLDDDELVGVVCRCRLVPPVLAGETVADRMTANFVTLKPWSTLAEAAELMSTAHTGCVPVVAEEKLYGVVTRGDLVRMGMPLAQFGIKPCDRCGGDHADRRHPQLENLAFCLDCLDRVLDRSEYAELPAPRKTAD